MKKLILAFLVLVGVAHANGIDESRTDIYFGNGIWNSRVDAEKNRVKLEKLINKHFIKNNPKLQRRYGDTKLAYNWNLGVGMDLIEAYIQLKKSGQFEGSGWNFFKIIYQLSMGNVNATLTAVLGKIFLINPATREEQRNVDEMWKQYYDDSLKLSHRVLLISHSQGGLFANRIYEKVKEKGYGDYFANIQVGSPAKNIEAKDGFRVALWGDPVVKLTGITEGNIQGSGHAFINAYLANEEALNKILFGAKHLLKTLDTYSSQWEAKETKEEDTKDYRAILEHKFDKNVMLFDEVYPFKLSGYVYQVPLSTTGQKEYVKASFLGDKILDADVDEWENKQDNQFYKLNGVNPPEYIMGKNPVYIYVFRPGININSVQFYMSDGTKSISINKQKAGISITDGAVGSPPQGYDRFKDSKWAGTKYEGKFNDTVLAVLPFEKESGWWCNNGRYGNCQRYDNNFKTTYSISYSDYLDDIYKQHFKNKTPFDKATPYHQTQPNFIYDLNTTF